MREKAVTEKDCLDELERLVERFVMFQIEQDEVTFMQTQGGNS